MSVDPAEGVETEGGVGFNFKKLLQEKNSLLILPALCIEGAEVEIAFTMLGRNLNGLLIGVDGELVPLQGGVYPAQQEVGRQVKGVHTNSRLTLLNGLVHQSLIDIEGGQLHAE